MNGTANRPKAIPLSGSERPSTCNRNSGRAVRMNPMCKRSMKLKMPGTTSLGLFLAIDRLCASDGLVLMISGSCTPIKASRNTIELKAEAA